MSLITETKKCSTENYRYMYLSLQQNEQDNNEHLNKQYTGIFASKSTSVFMLFQASKSILGIKSDWYKI